MRKTVKHLECEIEETAQSLEKQMRAFKEEAHLKLEGIKDKFSVRKQTENHPIEMVGGAALVGFLFGTLLFLSPSQMKSTPSNIS